MKYTSLFSTSLILIPTLTQTFALSIATPRSLLVARAGTQFITGPCTSDADCASGCCGFKSGKCAGPVIAQERDGGCGFGDPQPNNRAAQAIQGPNAEAAPANNNSDNGSNNANSGSNNGQGQTSTTQAASTRTATTSAATGTQFITGACSSDADCASGCCGFKSGKCAGPVIAQERDGGCGFGDPQPNNRAAQAIQGPNAEAAPGVNNNPSGNGNGNTQGSSSTGANNGNAGGGQATSASSATSSAAVPSGTQFITGACKSDADCASGCCGFHSGKCAGPVIAQERDGGCGFGDPQPNNRAAQAIQGPNAEAAPGVNNNNNAGSGAASGNANGNANGNGNGNNGGQNAGNNNSNNNGTGNDQGDAQSSLTLDPRVIATGFAQDGQQTPTDGQVASLTSKNNFINFCLTVPDLPITNGQQIKSGSCNPAPIGAIPSVDNMPSSKFTSPANGDTIQANKAFTISMAIKNIETGNFVNADTNYFAAPQQLNKQGQIVGHSHVVVEELDGGLGSTNPTDPKNFVFFKGINGKAQNGLVTADVTSGLPAGAYRMCSINAAANHQPVIVPVAQHGALDDCVYFTVSNNAGGNRNGNGNGNGNGNNGGNAQNTGNGNGTGAQNNRRQIFVREH
ncbi:hypothetical protein K435DRAFT_842411 [Dendrothele bispora CBS 962.96]|uniref:Uncharacterized protein n=1 Tax=Dendrothele bispora (strain CBS 962.96) TaxID=1314807 RepID=A0A4S8LFW5_DENBC|nr:hypothetical protein K435DRAFT_842411 [Dendrothele bispora CBS 962.96]